MPSRGPDRTRNLWILALLVALALGMRLASAGRLLPQQREPDAFEVYEMQRVQGDQALVKGVNFQERYPWLLAWTLAALPAAHPPRDASAADAERLHLAAAAQPFLRVRIAVALLATLQVLLTFFLARRFLPEGAALAAVFLVATSLLHLLFSVEARPHGANAGLTLLALIATLQLGQRFAFGRLALAVVTSAAAIATFQLGLATLPPLFLACLLLEGVPRGRRIALALCAPLAALALALPWYTNRPYIDATGVHMASAEGGGHTLFFQGMDFLGSLRGAQLVFEHDPLLALLAAAGLVLLLARARNSWRAADADTRRSLAVAGAFALPYALVITIQGEVYERFLMPLVPFVAILGAVALLALWRRPAARALALLALGLAALSAGQFVRLAQVPDAYEQAAEWVRQHVPREANLTVFPDVSLPLLYTPAAVAAQMQDISARNMPWVTYQATIPALPAGAPAWNVRCVPRQLVVQRATVEALRAWLPRSASNTWSSSTAV
jgi:4-amino-4-deoxy-L-arabinose transferase-like glycosyltransferase